jgi:hypothetical protein
MPIVNQTIECEECGWRGFYSDLRLNIFGSRLTMECPSCLSTNAWLVQNPPEGLDVKENTKDDFDDSWWEDTD